MTTEKKESFHRQLGVVNTILLTIATAGIGYGIQKLDKLEDNQSDMMQNIAMMKESQHENLPRLNQVVKDVSSIHAAVSVLQSQEAILEKKVFKFNPNDDQ